MKNFIPYSVVQTGSYFDWNYFLNKTRRTSAEWTDASQVAGNFVTCACGNQCFKIPRDSEGVPEDEILGELAVEFSFRITGSRRKRALETITKIEKRASEILIEMNNAK